MPATASPAPLAAPSTQNCGGGAGLAGCKRSAGGGQDSIVLVRRLGSKGEKGGSRAGVGAGGRPLAKVAHLHTFSALGFRDSSSWILAPLGFRGS